MRGKLVLKHKSNIGNMSWVGNPDFEIVVEEGGEVYIILVS